MNQQEPLPWPIPGMSERQSILFLAQDLGHQVNRWKRGGLVERQDRAVGHRSREGGARRRDGAHVD